MSEIFIDGHNSSPLGTEHDAGFEGGLFVGSTPIQDMVSVCDSLISDKDVDVDHLGYIEGSMRKIDIGGFLPSHDSETFRRFTDLNNAFSEPRLFFNDDKVGRWKRRMDISVTDDEDGFSRSDLMSMLDGWPISVDRARHQMIFGQTRTGKSVAYMRVMTTCLEHGWTIIDLHDSGGRLECAPMGFSLDDPKLRSIIRNRWKDVGLDSNTMAMRAIRDIDKLEERCMMYHNVDDFHPHDVVYYHPYVSGIPDEVPETGNVRFKFFSLGTSDVFDMMDGDVMDYMFSLFGESLTESEKEKLSFVRAFFRNMGRKEYLMMSLDDVVNVLIEWRESEDEITIPMGSENRPVSMDFTDKRTMDLIRKVSEIAESGLFQPVYYMEDGELVRNDRVLDLREIVDEKGVVHAFTTKWADSDLKYIVISYLIDKIYNMKRRGMIGGNIFLGSREINELVPSRPAGIENMTASRFEKIISRGADLGIRLVGDAQQVMSVSRNLKRNVHVMTCFRITGSSEKDEIKRSLSNYVLDDNFRDNLSSLGVGECFVTTRSIAGYVKVIPSTSMSKIEGVDMISLMREYPDGMVREVDKSDIGDFGMMGLEMDIDDLVDDMMSVDDDSSDFIGGLMDGGGDGDEDVIDEDDVDVDDGSDDDVDLELSKDAYDMDKVERYECPEFLMYHDLMGYMSDVYSYNRKVLILSLVKSLVDEKMRITASDVVDIGEQVGYDFTGVDEGTKKATVSKLMRAFEGDDVIYMYPDAPGCLFVDADVFSSDGNVDDEYVESLIDFVDNMISFMKDAGIDVDFVDLIEDYLLNL